MKIAVRKLRASALAVCLATTLCSGGVLASPVDEAAAAYARGDYPTAFRLWHAQAEEGDGNAQMVLGFMYHDGEGVPKDLVRAYMWFYLAASRFDADSQDFRDAMDARDMTAKDMTSEQIQQARDMAQTCQSQLYKNCD